MPITFTMPGHFDKQQWEKTVVEELHNGGPELAQLEVFNITARSPEDTAALKHDITGKGDFSPTSDIIATVTEGTANQLAEWGRVYAQYQEGGALGLSTYTNAPHEMYARAFTEDIGAITAWGNKWLQKAADRLAAGNGVP